jgi:hypothetical protein
MSAIKRVLGFALLIIAVACSEDLIAEPPTDPLEVRVEPTPHTTELAPGGYRATSLRRD